MENAHPLFAQALRVTFRLYTNPVKMARSVKKLFKWIKDQLAAQATREKDGVQQVLVVRVGNTEYRRQLTADGGIFIVVVRPPVDMAAVAPINLLFSFRDLYLLGYQANADAGGKWRLYSDAYLIGTGADNPDNAAYWDFLAFRGGYTEEMKTIPVGMLPMYYALYTLNNPASGNVQLALAVYIYVIPEALRFPEWMIYLVAMLRRFGSEPLTTPSHQLNAHFNNWSTLCKHIRRGPTAFVRVGYFDTYKGDHTHCTQPTSLC